MGYDIGFAKGFDWAPRPASRLVDELVLMFEEYDDGTTGITLNEVRTACQNVRNFPDVEGPEQANADKFQAWCEDYWKQRQFGEDDKITLIQSW